MLVANMLKGGRPTLEPDAKFAVRIPPLPEKTLTVVALPLGIIPLARPAHEERCNPLGG